MEKPIIVTSFINMYIMDKTYKRKFQGYFEFEVHLQKITKFVEEEVTIRLYVY